MIENVWIHNVLACTQGRLYWVTKSQPQAQTQTQRRVDQSKNLLNGVQRDKNPPNISIGAFLCCVISKQEGALGDLNNWET